MCCGNHAGHDSLLAESYVKHALGRGTAPLVLVRQDAFCVEYDESVAVEEVLLQPLSHQDGCAAL